MALGRWVGMYKQLRNRLHTGQVWLGEAGDGVWAIYMSGDDGKAHVEQVYKAELDALRANKLNTDPNRNVRFLPYGIDVSVLDAGSGEARPDDAQHDAVEP
jgi:hypothetical protein